MWEITNKWFKYFLSDRCQYTNIKECSTRNFLITHGVKKGSALEP